MEVNIFNYEQIVNDTSEFLKDQTVSSVKIFHEVCQSKLKYILIKQILEFNKESLRVKAALKQQILHFTDTCHIFCILADSKANLNCSTVYKSHEICSFAGQNVQNPNRVLFKKFTWQFVMSVWFQLHIYNRFLENCQSVMKFISFSHVLLCVYALLLSVNTQRRKYYMCLLKHPFPRACERASVCVHIWLHAALQDALINAHCSSALSCPCSWLLIKH